MTGSFGFLRRGPLGAPLGQEHASGAGGRSVQGACTDSGNDMQLRVTLGSVGKFTDKNLCRYLNFT